jgi:photosystem II stability/assembly factor-like uncharacterized protein
VGVRLAVGTVKGAFVLDSDEERRRWSLRGPLFTGWIVSAFGDGPDDSYLLATASTWYGAAIHRSKDFEHWEQIIEGPSYGEGQNRKLTQIWRMVDLDGALYAGVDQAGLFRSADGGESWEPLEGLNEHASRPGWQPGLGGECAHAILTDSATGRLWCGISAVGVFRSDDGGVTWEPRNEGVPKAVESSDYPDIGFCVHGLVQDPENPDRIYRQDHQGVFRTNDGGDSWQRIENGLPAGFGFAIAIDPSTRSLFVVPLESDEYRLPVGGRLRVYRSTDGGDSWHPSGTGLRDDLMYAGVLRGAITTDRLHPGGVYFGTTAGTLHYTNDSGETWVNLPYVLPRIVAVYAYPT